MSDSETAVNVHIEVRTTDAATEIFLLDGQFQVAARGVGSLSADQPAGIYKLKLKTGAAVDERMVILRDAAVTIDPKPVEFASSAPLADTAKTHEYHMDAAQRISNSPGLSCGQGSSIFVFARDWNRFPGSSLPINPARGLRLKRFDTDEVVVDVETQSAVDLTRDPCAGVRVEVDPGAYRLSLDLGSHEVFETCVMTAPGWQTQVFLLQREQRRNRSESGPKNADLWRASIDMSRGAGFDAQNRSFRLSEMARQALTNERPVLKDGDLLALLRGKFDDPMLGIFGGHLLLAQPEPDLELVKTVVHNLRATLGTPHPDVEALALACGLYDGFVFRYPPMLQRSWAVIVEYSAERPELVLPDFFSFKISDRLTTQPPWLIWNSVQSQEDALEDGFVRVVQQYMQPGSGGRLLKTVEQTLAPRKQSLADLEEALLSAFTEHRSEEINLTGILNSVQELAVQTLVRVLGLPRAKVEELMNSVGHQLGL